jgi:pimeloyl-ACP methyl ester carboxylesterase
VTPTHHLIDAGSCTLHYAEVESNRPPLLLLHGIGMDWRVWQAVSRRLAPHFRVIMVDLRGHGRSCKPASGYGLADYALDVERLINGLGLHNVTLAGSSLGALVAVTVEAREEVVARRVLVDPPFGRGEGRPLFREILEIKESGLTSGQSQQAIFEALSRDNRRAGTLLLKYMSETWVATAPAALREALQPGTWRNELELALRDIASPVLIMRGNEALGSVLSDEASRHALELLPRGREAYFAGAGHAIHGQRPAQFVSELLSFVSACPTSGQLPASVLVG